MNKMSSVEKIAIKVGKNIREILDTDEDKEQIIIYGAINLFQIILSIFWVIFFGFLLGVFYEALIFSFTVSILRKYSGGVHATSPLNCIIIGTISSSIFGIIIHCMLYNINIYVLMLISIVNIIFSSLIIIEKAPVDSVNKPITDINLRVYFKKKSIVVIVIYSTIIAFLTILSLKYSYLKYIKFIESIDFGILWQTITLTQIGKSLFNKIEFILNYVMRGGKEYGK